jgi:glucuronate isomerase
MTNPPGWLLDPDRLFPIETETRAIARDLFGRVEDLPILSPHGHVAPTLLVENQPFDDPAELLIVHDHYVTRLLHASGLDLANLGVGRSAAADPREVWRAFARHWHLYAGTASGYWLTHELITLFGLEEAPSEANADRQYDQIDQRIAQDDFRPRALFERFGIEVLATTDDPLDDLAAHAALAADPSFRGRVLPTFRPDAYIDPTAAAFVENVERLTDAAGVAADDFDGYLDSLAQRRAHFIDHGAVSADHGVREPYTADLDPDDAARLYRGAIAGKLSAAQKRELGGYMLLQMAQMSVRDGLVMTVHPGVLRNHSSGTFSRLGPDTGHDIPITTEYTRNLQPMLERFGNEKDFHLILFTVDETSYSREIAPLAGFYPSVFIGAPWWFLDAPDAIQRFRAATTETAGFYRGSGFIDDTRAFLSIPARHDTARRLDAAYLARLVREGRLDLLQAQQIIVDLVDAIPRKAFKL